MSSFPLKDLKAIPDIIHEYPDNLKSDRVPLVIDNGSYQCRVGWAINENPLLTFRNLIAKPRKDRNKKDLEQLTAPAIQIGNDIVNIEAMRFQLKTQFDRNVVTHFQNQEQILDYIFGHLGINTAGRIMHPIIMTECFANPNYNRQLMSELLFECYDIPSVSYGVDALFSFQHNKPEANGLIICCGYHTTHVIPVLDNIVIATKVKRINLGGYHIITFLHRLLQLKYPGHINAISLSRVEELLMDHCSVAYDYIDKLKKWASLDFYERNVKKVQLPFAQPSSSGVTLTAEQKFEKKRELARRLTEINARKRESRLAEDEDQLQKLLKIQDLHENGEDRQFKAALKQNAIASADELEKLIVNTSNKVDKTKQKMAESEQVVTQTIFEEKPELPQPPPDVSVEEWIADIKTKRFSLIDKRQLRRQRKTDSAKRRTAAGQERMRIISQLARKEKGTDDFGMRDEDWDVYKAISRENGDSDSEVENEKMMEYEEVLRHHDPTFEEMNGVQGGAAELYQLHVGVEAHRAPEILFQPSMIGSSEAGLAETIQYVLKMFTDEEQLVLANNVFVTGGCAKIKGLQERLSREMMEMRPFQSTFNVSISKNPSFDAWYGARDFANRPDLHQYLITKSDYNELGGEYLKEHNCSNLYFKTPAPIPIAQPDEVVATAVTEMIVDEF